MIDLIPEEFLEAGKQGKDTVSLVNVAGLEKQEKKPLPATILARQKKWTRFVEVVTIVLMLNLISVTNIPAAAVESLGVNPKKGKMGDKVYITGSGYKPGDMVYVYFSDEKTKKGDPVDDLRTWKWIKTIFAGGKGWENEGRLSTSFKIPFILDHGREDQDVKGGKYYVYATYDSRGRIMARDGFTVTGLKDVHPTEGPSGTRVRIEGSGFSADKEIDIYYDGEEIRISSGDKETDKNGDFRFLIVIPPGAEGEHNITVEIDGAEDEAEFTLISEQ